MAFFTFDQNNSGGSYVGDFQFIIIDAPHAEWANDMAADHGIYFNGCSLGWDCDCCGDRWSRVDDDDATDSPEIWGTPAAEYRDWNGKAPAYKIVRSLPAGA